MRYTQPLITSQTQHAKALVLEWHACGEAYDESVLKETINEDLHELVYDSVGSHCRTHVDVMFPDLICQATLFCKLQVKTDTFADTCSYHRRNSKNHRGKLGNSSGTFSVLKSVWATSNATVTLTKDASEMMHMRSGPQSISTLDTPSTNGSSGTYFIFVPFCLICFGKSHRPSQCQLIPNPFLGGFFESREKIGKLLPPKPQKKMEYQSSSVQHRGQQKLPTKKNVQDTQSQPAPSANEQSKCYRERSSGRWFLHPVTLHKKFGTSSKARRCRKVRSRALPDIPAFGCSVQHHREPLSSKDRNCNIRHRDI